MLLVVVVIAQYCQPIRRKSSEKRVNDDIRATEDDPLKYCDVGSFAVACLFAAAACLLQHTAKVWKFISLNGSNGINNNIMRKR